MGRPPFLLPLVGGIEGGPFPPGSHFSHQISLDETLELFLNKNSKLLDTDTTDQHGFFLVFYKNIRVDP